MPDLEDDAPKPSHSAGTTPDSGAPTSKEPKRWSKWAIAFAAAAATVVVVGIAVIIGSTNDTTESAGENGIYGVWIVEAYTMNGQTTTIDPADFEPLMRSTPYVEITAAEVSGDDGCNDFGSQGPPEYSDGRLLIGEVVASAVGCLDLVEAPLLSAMWETGEVEATVTADAMTWTTDTNEIRFRRVERIPAPSAPAWPTQEGRLDCSPSFVVGVNIPAADSATAPSVLIALDGVVEVEGDGVLGSADPFAWGLNADGIVIAGAAPGDIEPPVIHLSACAEQFGLRPDADPAAAVSIWVNDLGLAQPYSHMWGDRFVELCASSVDDLPALAERYVHEDAYTSLRPGGALPSVEEATNALKTIQMSVCA